MPKIKELNNRLIASTMQLARIPGVSVASVDNAGEISATTIGKTDKHTTPAEDAVHENTVFGAASLSKAVFAYLALKIIDKGLLPDINNKPFNLDTPLAEILPLKKFFKKAFNQTISPEVEEQSKMITARMILAHTSGISDFDSPKLHFTPGTEYEYSGIGMVYLQKVLEKQTGKSLETLAQEEVFKPLKMTHSSFLPPPRPHYMQHTVSSTVKIAAKLNPPLKPPLAANSLHTTASDYAKLMHAWMHDPSELMQSAFTPQINLRHDRWARELGVSDEDCSHLAWGLGVGLELDDKNRAIRAFHTGDMNQWRAWCAMDLEKNEAIVYFANGRHHKDANGHVLADLIVTPKVEVPHAQRWFTQKFGFARDISPGWKEREGATMSRIGEYISRTRAGDTADIAQEENVEDRAASSESPLSETQESSLSPFSMTPNPPDGR